MWETLWDYALISVDVDVDVDEMSSVREQQSIVSYQ